MIGVCRASSFRTNAAGVLTMGLNSSEGNVPDPGVGREAVLAVDFFSKPAAAIVADEVAVAMVGCRRLREEATEESNE